MRKMPQNQISVPSPASRLQRYRMSSRLGAGAFGSVVSAVDVLAEELVAIKCMRVPLTCPEYAKRVLREVRLLRLLHGHENIVLIKDVIVRDGTTEKEM